MKRFYLLLFLLVCLSFSSFAQDVIYLVKGKSQPGKLWEIDGDKFKFKSPNDRLGPMFNFKLSAVVLAFNYRADFIGFKNGTSLVSDEEIKAFIYPKYELRPNDLVIDQTGNIFTAKVTSTDKDDFVGGFTNNAAFKIPKANVVAILRRDGTHQIFVAAETARDWLMSVKPKIKQLLSKPEEAEPVVKPTIAPTVNTGNPGAGNAGSVNTGTVANTGGSKPTLSALDKEAFHQKSISKVKEFTGYLDALSNESTTIDQADKIENLTCDLFVDEEARVESSSVYTKAKKKTKIRPYLKKVSVRSGKFSKIDVEYSDFSYANDFKLGKDGRYYGTVTYSQRFQGFLDKELVYADITTRSATVVLKQYTKAVEGGYVKLWDVFLGDVGVRETEKLDVKQ